MAIFDYFDIFYLANTLTIPQLRHEIQQAELKATLQNTFLGTPYQDKNDDFPWTEYAKYCREALECLQKSRKGKPSPVPIGHINIDSLRERNDIVAVIEQYTQLRKSGHNRFLGRCPLHEDKHPSMTVYASEQVWHCFQCGKGGDIFDFIMAVNTCDFKQAAAILGNR